MKRSLALILILAILCGIMHLSVFATEREDVEVGVAWELGTIRAATGEEYEYTTRIRTADYIPISDYTAVALNTGYAITYFVYDADYNYLGNGNPEFIKNWLGNGDGITTDELKLRYPTGAYFRLAMRKYDESDTTLEDVGTSGVRFVTGKEILWEQGSLYSTTGLGLEKTHVIRTMNFLPLADYSGVTIDPGYTLLYLVYDAQLNYLGNGSDTGTANWLGSGVSLLTEDVMEIYPDGAYFRLLIKKPTSELTDITIEAAKDSNVHFYLAGEDVPVREKELTQETLMSIIRCQDGAIWGGKAFIFNNKGDCTVYDLSTKTMRGSFTLDKADILNPHANAVCFGNTYYAEGDTYPLLYVNIYNNYKNETDRREGICLVHRLTEIDGVFSTTLVQVLKIGFVEDLSLWKSMEGTGDIRPYGNFVVDTDHNKLYAFVRRWAYGQMRFFQFDLPALNEGTYNAEYGCNVVTLESSDIQRMFDTEYFEVIQGCCYYDGKILALQGLYSGMYAEPALRIVDLETGTVENTHWFADAELTAEPEMIYVDHNSGVIYYAAIDGVLRTLKIPEIHTHTYEKGICTVCGKVQPGPVITTQPRDVSVDRFAEATVSIAAEGDDLRYQWYYRCVGEAAFRVSACDSNTFRTVMSGDLHGCEVYCVVTDSSGNTAASDTVTLTLTEDPAPEEPTVRIPGDLNGDGSVNNKDLIRLFRYLTGWDVTLE